MLSVGRREDERRGISFGKGGMDDDNELEEGEAWFGQEDDSCVDPDTFSYIDEKIQNVLGHFQKDFEAGVSAENLGAKFGGYGSFLPTYQRSPSVLCQTRSPYKFPNQNVKRSPSNTTVEAANPNPSFSKNNTFAVPFHDSKCQADAYMDEQKIQEPSSQHYFNKTTNGSDHNSLKLRIKVGPDNTLPRSNAAIYSGLGLDISPSSSYEDSPDGSGGISPEFQNLPGESPNAIIQVMTCFSVPDGSLISPLPDSLFQLMEKGSFIMKKPKREILNGLPQTSAEFADSTTLLGDVKSQMEKHTKSREQKARPRELKYSKDEADANLSRDIDIETLVGEGPHLNSSSKNASEKSDRQTVVNTTKNDSKMLDHLIETKKASLKERSACPALSKNKEFDLIDNTTKNGPSNSGNEFMPSRGQLNSRGSNPVKATGEQITKILQDEKLDLHKEVRSRADKDYDTPKNHSSGLKRKNEQIAGTEDHLKSCSPFRDKALQVKDQVPDKKKKLKAGKTTSESFGEHSKDTISGNSSAMPKEKQKKVHTKAGPADKSAKVVKSHKDLDGACMRNSHGNSSQDDKAEQFENGFGTPDVSLSGKQKSMKDKHEKELPVTSAQTFKEKSGSKKAENTTVSEPLFSEPILAPVSSKVPASSATIVPQAPIVIKENWVCCDVCQKWRLLPYGTNTGHLPKQWQCNLLNWLPGMNSCDISEEETTNALHALYAAPAPVSGGSIDDHHSVAPSNASLTVGVHLDQNPLPNTQNVPTTGKKKGAIKPVSNIASHSTPTQISNSVKDQLATFKHRCQDDVNPNHPFEPNMSSKGTFGNTSRTTDISAEKQKQKSNNKNTSNRPYSDGGYHSEKTKKRSEPKSKGEVHQDDLRERKKQKKDNLQYSNKYSSNSDIAAIATEETDAVPRCNKFPLSKDSKNDSKPNSSSSKKLRNEDQFITNGESREYFRVTDSEKLNNMDPPLKKRKGKEWKGQTHQEAFGTGQHSVENDFLVQGALCGTDPVKDEKGEEKGSKTMKLNNWTDRKVNTSRMSLPSSGDHLHAEMDNDALYVAEKEHRSMQGDAGSLRELQYDSSKRDLTCTQIPVAANSSSSKVSSSHRNRSNIQEMKGSPVESVSSSPMRISNIDKLSHKRILQHKDTATNAGSSALGSKRHWDTEVNCRNGQSGKDKKEVTFSDQEQSLQRHRLAKSAILGCLEEPFDFEEKETNHFYGGKSEDRLHVKRGADTDFSPTDPAEFKDRIQDSNKANRHHLMNGPTQRKSGNTSSVFKEKHRGSRSDIDKSKLRVSDNENKDMRRMKNASGCRTEVSSNSHEQPLRPDVLRNEKVYLVEKDEKEFSGKDDPTSKGMTSRRDNSLATAFQERMDGNNNYVVSNKPKEPDSKHLALGTRSIKPESRGAPSFQHENALNNHTSDRTDCQELLSGPGRPQLKLISRDIQETRARVPNVVTSPHKESRLDVDVADTSKVFNHRRQLDCQNGSHHNSLRNGTLIGPPTSSPIRKENHSVVLKEARDLKHTANRLKEEGLELESTGLYFEAALKFLHVASLMEPVNFDTSKQAEAAQMYFETAKLCEFVAHEYEKAKDMAAASLAYKCVEVAYLKAAYCKNPNASKDRHELQTALHIFLPGESPSSSASDVDNLNNQSTIGKNALAKGTSSPQVAGNHVIAARHHQQVLRLIHYTNDLNCAFEATKKSQIAIAAANVNLEKDRVECISFIRNVLDFNFHNVEGLLRLVRLSLESIGR